MKETKLANLACRHCRYYQLEGRRGGFCQKLGATVDSNWQACVLASAPFEDNLKALEQTITTLEEIVHLETAYSLPYKSSAQSCLKPKKAQKTEISVANKVSFPQS
jgi:hypothetical protein